MGICQRNVNGDMYHSNLTEDFKLITDNELDSDEIVSGSGLLIA